MSTDLQKKDELRRELQTLEIAVELINSLEKGDLTELQKFQQEQITKRISAIEKALED